MSSISSLSSAAQFAPTRGLRAPGQGRDSGPPPEVREQFEASFASAAKEVGVDASQFAKVGGQIQDALSKLDLSSSDDPQAAVEQVVNQTLQSNNIDPDQFKADFEKVLNQLGGPDGSSGPARGFAPPRASGTGQGQNSQDLLNTLLKSLDQDSDDTGNSSTRIAEFLASAKAGSFFDQQA